jgi:hypothetical protein
MRVPKKRPLIDREARQHARAFAFRQPRLRLHALIRGDSRDGFVARAVSRLVDSRSSE